LNVGACSDESLAKINFQLILVRMMDKSINSFPQEVCDILGYYVYRLIDPRNGHTFYIGKGKNNRVFQHLKLEPNLDGEDDEDLKISLIREVKLAGLEPILIIHRHGLEENESFEVEAALIDAFPEVLNIQGGKGSNDFGPMNTHQIIQKYSAQIAEFRHKLLLITVNNSVEKRSIYDATRMAWKVSVSRAEKSEYVLAIVQGMIVEVFKPFEWKNTTIKNFPSRIHDSPDRYGFEGERAEDSIRSLYVGKRIPDDLRKRGAANPIRYINL
jgi:hypothetical protein